MPNHQMMTEERGDPLAEWTFFNPSSWSMSTSSYGNYRATLASSEGEAIRRLASRVQDLKKLLASKNLAYDSEGRATVQVLHQHNGAMVHVPAGWPHQVLNLKPCVKLAWDCYDPVNMARYAQSWLYIRGKYMPRSDDYMGAAVVLKNATVSLYRQRKK